MKTYELVIIGGGPAGLAAAVAACEEGIQSILILEREARLGGILNQCIHNGFGLHIFKEELTGPEYSQRYINMINFKNIQYKTGTMVIDLDKDKLITAVNPDEGLIQIQAKAVILAMGCRERPRGALNIPGARCSGILTAGTAQKFVNMEGMMPGKNVVILGSGDIGLIMARRMTLEGAKVQAVVELMPYSTGLTRNIVQCLKDFDIPLLLSHTVIEIKGKDRLESVVVAQVDEHRKPLPGTEQLFSCDTLLLSVGLLPENELSKKAGVKLSPSTGGAVVSESMETSRSGIFSCGNVLHVHDLVDHVSSEGALAGKAAARYIKGITAEAAAIKVTAADGVRYTVPQTINPHHIEDEVNIRFRTAGIYLNSHISVYFDNTRVFRQKKRILTPGEMESVRITAEDLRKHTDCKIISVRIEGE